MVWIAKRIGPVTLFGSTLSNKLSSELWSDLKKVPFYLIGIMLKISTMPPFQQQTDNYRRNDESSYRD